MVELKKGILVSFEGPEGSGKSTLVQAVGSLLKLKNYSVVMTREPGGVPLAEKLRKILLKKNLHPWSELFLYQAARAEHFFKLIMPALKNKQIVLCDRFIDSTLAYQSKGRGLPWKKVQYLNQLATENTIPDLTIFLNVDPQVSLKKANHPNRFEKENLQFHQRVYQGFLQAQKQFPHRWLTLNAYSDSPEIMAHQVLSILEQKI